MASAANSQIKSKSARKGSVLGNAYLLAYNAVSAGLWFSVLLSVVQIGSQEGVRSGKVYERLEHWARVVQTGAVAEVVHSLVGLVRAPLLTTLMQVASRLLLVWGIGYNFPSTTQYSPAYSSMLVAWSVTEVIRYSYFVFVLAGKGVPALWTWLRYNTFLVLYPIGVASETWLVFRAIQPAERLDERYGYALWAVLATYVPGFYMLFTHMLKQRSKIMKAKRI